jgi:hypothetical protein
MTDRPARSPYVVIMVAAHNGRGVILSPAEVQALADDDAIATTAVNHLPVDQFERTWKQVDPRAAKPAP